MSNHVKGMTSCQPTGDDCISRQAAIDALDCINGVEEVLRSLPAAQLDLSGYSDRLWKAAYERGKAEAQPDIIHCGECKYYHASYCEVWSRFGTIQTRENGFCYMAERKEGEADERPM